MQQIDLQMRLCLGVVEAGIEAWRGRGACKNAPPYHMQHPAVRTHSETSKCFR
jgi:hypothetical protein